MSHPLTVVKGEFLPQCDLDMRLVVSGVGTDQRIECSVSASAVPPAITASHPTLDFPSCAVGEVVVW